jgi:hypothetical protein
MQDLHEQRVVMMRLLMDALKTIPQIGGSVQRAKLLAGFAKKGELACEVQAAKAGCKV